MKGTTHAHQREYHVLVGDKDRAMKWVEETYGLGKDVPFDWGMVVRWDFDGDKTIYWTSEHYQNMLYMPKIQSVGIFENITYGEAKKRYPNVFSRLTTK